MFRLLTYWEAHQNVAAPELKPLVIGSQLRVIMFSHDSNGDFYNVFTGRK